MATKIDKLGDAGLSTELSRGEAGTCHLPMTGIDSEKDGRSEHMICDGNIGISSYLSAVLAPASMQYPLYLQSFATGVLDATTYADFGTFASNQTGNTILVTLAAFNTIPVTLQLTGVSLASFVVSAFIAGNIGHRVGHRTRWWLLLSNCLQNIILLGCLIPSFWLRDFMIGPHQWVMMMCFACSAGVQVAMARHVGCPEIPTAMLSSPLVDYITDPHLFRRWSDPRASARNRRTIYVFSIISGSFLGAALHRHAGKGWAIATAILVKLCMTAIIAVAKSQASADE
ncbi:hypothetical protein HD553DRAFT_51987 [Filobasidium floriforme]|uniref:uncharacterized protein n=1 Tax=Filobasidium floriforme TaxID=5210 RepID=UPI001E8E3429|nr:uncharacterized protein HD553DRAFT_51987 [Filobasidium floriforme]KAH8083736.1 hypothetical protein HD553DRAFT_51987 [Filobasidium floriforme]